MKHLTWDYRGYDDLGLNINDDTIQGDWNATLINKIREGFDSEGICCAFISKEYIDILYPILLFSPNKMTLGSNIKIIPIEVNTPKIYVTEGTMDYFVGMEHNNYGSVVIKNYGNNGR